VVENVLKMDGVLVMEAITTPEARYETYVRSVDLINTIVFPGSCCPSLHALMNAAYQNSLLSLEVSEPLALWKRAKLKLSYSRCSTLITSVSTTRKR